MAKHVEAMVGFLDAGAEVFDYGNSIRDEARKGGYERAFAFPGFVPAYIRPLFCEGKGPFRWAALSGDPADIAATDRAVLDLFPDNDHLQRWIRAAQERVAFQGLPGPDLLARLRRAGQGRRCGSTRWSPPARSAAPIVIGRDHLDSGSVASPYRETEAMADGSDAIADWPLLNALVNTASGATWVSIHHGGGVGIGRSIHAGQVVRRRRHRRWRAQKLERVLTNDPAMGVIRHVDAGYDLAAQVAEERGVRVPMREGDGEREPFDGMWADLAPVGRDAATGGYRGSPGREDAELREWFAGEAERRGLDVVADRAGNLWAWRGDPDRDGPGLVLG